MVFEGPAAVTFGVQAAQLRFDKSGDYGARSDRSGIRRPRDGGDAADESPRQAKVGYEQRPVYRNLLIEGMTIESLAAGIRRERGARRRLVSLSDALVVTAQDVVNSPYVVTGETGSVHIYPTPALSEQIKAQQAPALGPGVLSYDGGPIMTGVNLYAIFRVPAKLQNGHSTSLTAKYESVAPAAIPSLRQLHY